MGIADDLESESRDVSSQIGDGSVSFRGHPLDKEKTGKWRANGFILGLLLADTISILGIAGNLVPYAFSTLHLSIAKSANTTAYYVGVSTLIPLLSGYIADSYLGRFWLMCLCSVIGSAGLIILTLSVSLQAWKPPSCTPTVTNPICPEASQRILNWWFTGLYLVAVGSGGLKPCMASMGQDQFDATDPVEKKSGLFWFSTYYLTGNLGSLLGATIFFYLQSNVSYGWGYRAILGLYIVAISLFLAGTPWYRHQKPGGSPLTRLAQVMVVTFKTLNESTAPDHVDHLYDADEVDGNNKPIQKLLRTPRLRFFDRAAIVRGATAQADWESRTARKENRWRLCTVTQVEEFKTVVEILPIWVNTTIVYIVLSQVQGVTVQQAASLDRKFGPHFTMPPGSAGVFLVTTAILFIPTWEFGIVPGLRKITGYPKGITPLKQIGIGLFLAIFAMVVAALVERKRVKVIREHSVNLFLITKGLTPMSIFYLLPQFAILGVVEFLIGTAQLHFFYAETPDNMRSLATSLFFASVSVGYFCSTALVNAVNKYTKNSGGWLAGDFYSGGLKKYYWLLSIIMAVNLVTFTFFAHMYTYKTLLSSEDEGQGTFPDDQEISGESKPPRGGIQNSGVPGRSTRVSASG